MRNILFSCFNKADQAYIDYLQLFIDEADNYEKGMKVKNVLKDTERKYFKYIIDSFSSSGQTPSQFLFEQNFSETAGAFATCKDIPIQDFRVYVFNLIDARVNSYIHSRITELNQKVKDEGMTSEIMDEFSRLQGLSNRNKSQDISVTIDAEQEYRYMELRPEGMKTGIKDVDERIGGMNPGTVTTIAGFTSQFKTTWALNIAHLNAYLFGYNVAYISLETPKQDMYWNLLSLHSYEDHLSKYTFIPHEKIRNCTLSKEEQDYLFNTVQKDLYSDVDYGDGTGPHPRGRVVILDESDFKTFSFGEITSVLEKVDDKLNGGLDAVVIDYVQLCKFSGSGMTLDANAQINSYAAFFRRLSQNFRKVIDANGTETVKQLIMILLAQLNRTGWQKAARNNGRYDLTALADANELERGSARIFTTYTTEDMKARNSAQVQILKNRQGQTMYDPALVFVEPAAYLFCNETAGQGVIMASVNGGSGQAIIDSMFSQDDSDIFAGSGII